MSDFDFTPLAPDEEVVFGVVTSTSRSSHRVEENGRVVEDNTISSERKIGVTNQRVIIETSGQPHATQIIPNGDVQRVFLKRNKFMGETRLELVAIGALSTPRVELGIGFLEAADEPRIRATFPAAAMVDDGAAAAVPNDASYALNAPPKKKGLLSFLGLGG